MFRLSLTGFPFYILQNPSNWLDIPGVRRLLSLAPGVLMKDREFHMGQLMQLCLTFHMNALYANNVVQSYPQYHVGDSPTPLLRIFAE